MDNTLNLIMPITSLVCSIGNLILLAINHKRIRSTCCGKKAEISIDIENTSPINKGLCGAQKPYQAPLMT